MCRAAFCACREISGRDYITSSRTGIRTSARKTGNANLTAALEVPMRNDTESANRYVLPGKHVAFWIDTTGPSSYPEAGDFPGVVDAVVIGGGITGLTVAALLQEEGLSVALCEARRIAMGVTGHTTAKITSMHGLFYDYLTTKFGRELAGLYAEANQAAIGNIEALVTRREISCDFSRRPAYTYAMTDKDVSDVVAEAKAAEALGLPAAFVDRTALPFETMGAVVFERQAQFHPRKYLLALAGQLVSEGCMIFENTRALDIEEGNPCRVTTKGGIIRAKNVVIASYFPMKDPGFYFARMYPSRSYAMAVSLAGKIPDGMFYSACEPHWSLRSQPAQGGGELAVISGLSHKTGHGGNTFEYYRQLEEWVRGSFNVKSVEYCWSTQDNVTVDGVAYIGRLGPGYGKVFVATGYGQWGMTQSMAAAVIIRDAILGRRNSWAEIYDPNRLKRVRSTKLITENVHAVQHLVLSRLFSPDSFDPQQLQPGEGGIIRRKMGQVAVARDSTGMLNTVSPTCVHMGCINSWNPAEESWDCPCHGSRYAADGSVLQGPAQKDLEKKPLD